jgi:hypothetical protein
MWRERKRREESTNGPCMVLVDPEFKRAAKNGTRKLVLDYRRKGLRKTSFLTLVAGEYCVLCLK